MASIACLNNELLSLYPSLMTVTFLLREIEQLNNLYLEYDKVKDTRTFMDYLTNESNHRPELKRLLAKLNYFIGS